MEQIATKPMSEQDNRLTDWKDEPALMDLKAEFLATDSSHGVVVANIEEWARLHKGELPATMKADKTRSNAQPKLVRRQAEWKYSALSEPMLSSPRLFQVKPVTGEDADAALQNERLLNHQFNRQINRVAFVDHYVRSAVDEGTVVIRTGWNRETKKIKKKVPIYDYYAPSTQAEVELLQQAEQAREADPTTFELRAAPSLKAALAYSDANGQPVIAVDTGRTEEIVEEQIIKNAPTVEVIDPRNLRIDPTCGGDITKAMFQIYSFETTKADLKKDAKRLGYKNLDKVNWSAVGPLQTEYHHAQAEDTQFQFKDASRKKIVVHEYWGMYDIHGTGVLVPIVACWIGDVLIRMAENPYPDGLPPFVVVPYMPKKRSVHGEADAALLGDQQQNIGALLRGMIDILGRSAAGQTGIAAGTLDAVNKRRFESGQNYQYNPNTPVQNAIHHHQYPELSNSAVMLMTILNNDAEAITGTKAFSGGMSGDGYGKVAAGIRGMLDSAAKREMGILRRLVSGLVMLARKITAMNQVFLSDKEIVRITNEEPVSLDRPEGQTDEEFVTINRVELAGEFDIDIDIATAEVDEAQSQDLGFMLQTLGPKADWSVTKIILLEIARLKRLPQLEKAIKNYQPQVDPVAAKKAELEVALLEMEIAETQAKTALLRAQAAKATAEAEATDLASTQDATGVTHERKMQEGQSQAEGNQDYAITQALTKPTKEGEQSGDIEAAIGFNALTKDKNKPTPTIDSFMGPATQGAQGPLEPNGVYV